LLLVARVARVLGGDLCLGLNMEESPAWWKTALTYSRPPHCQGVSCGIIDIDYLAS
jgi:hypothetical protein